MSWYQPGNPNIQIAKSPKKNQESSYVQVPSSSPIYVKSSPTKEDNSVPPSIINVDEEKQKALECKRQAIRNHKDFPMVKQRFYYLQESDIFKGFYKGKGNLREVTKWLNENYDKEAILNKQQEQQQQEVNRRKEEHLKREKERFLQNVEKFDHEQKKTEQEKTLHQHKTNTPPPVNDDEDESPIKIRAKSRNTIDSPVKNQPSPEPQNHTTKVEINRPKMSILDKYKFRSNKIQPNLFQMMNKTNGSSDNNEQPKKRRLVRLSSLNSDEDRSRDSSPYSTNNSSPQTSLSDFSNKQGFSSWKKTADGKIVKDDEKPLIPNEDEGDKTDELELLEEKIKQNKRNKKKSTVIDVEEIDDDDDEDDEDDEMSQEDEYEADGLTSMDSQILEFLNNAEKQDIIEISSIPPKTSDILISLRPFNSIYDIYEHNFDTVTPQDDTKAKKKKTPRKTLGQKVIENTESSLKGYRAVDSLVKKCSEVGDLIAKQMSIWGVQTNGEGELEMVDVNPTQDNIEIDGNDNDDDDDDEVQVVAVNKKNRKKTLNYIHEPPSIFAHDMELKNYQIVGMNWLNLLYSNNLSCILADEMGLGKTCQVVAFMSYLKENNLSKGPHLVVVPSSTLENWLREFHKFCPELVIQAYYGSQSEREELRYDLRDAEFDVMVTTYNLASGSNQDFKFLRNISFDMVIYDEGHMLKNSNSERYNKLMRLSGKFRLLLTGTPLQNNLKELVSLLAFMLPKLFNEKREDLQGLFHQKVKTNEADEGYNPLLSIQAISKAKTMMTPFVLRRKKDQVLKHLPEKVHETVMCELTPTQYKIYQEEMNKGKRTRLERERRKLLSGKEAEEARKTPIPTSSNVLMALRKASLHPLLFRVHYTEEHLQEMSKAIMKEPDYVDANRQYIYEDMQVLADYELNNLCEKFPKTLKRYKLPDAKFLDSGKVKHLETILQTIINKGEKVLVFSLFTQVLDILERVMSLFNIKFLRLDGQTSVETRQDLIDKFYEDKTIPVFLLSTRAGGFGINLVAANNVIIFDQSFNPHDDKQAEDRAHRVGQKSKVMVTRLISKESVEENILQLACNKLQLDQSISTENNDKFEEKAANLFEKLLFDNEK